MILQGTTMLDQIFNSHFIHIYVLMVNGHVPHILNQWLATEVWACML